MTIRFNQAKKLHSLPFELMSLRGGRSLRLASGQASRRSNLLLEQEIASSSLRSSFATTLFI